MAETNGEKATMAFDRSWEVADLRASLAAAENKAANAQGILDQTNEHVAQLCELMGLKREAVPCDTYALAYAVQSLRRRAEDAELVAWGLANGLRGYGARLDKDGDPLPCIWGRRATNRADAPWEWELLWHDKKDRFQRVEVIGYDPDHVTLTPDARAALLAAREREKT